MKYQLGYDKCLFAPEDILLENGERLAGVGFYICFSTIFENEQPEECGIDLSSRVHVSFDGRTKEFSFYKDPELSAAYHVSEYCKFITEEQGSRVCSSIMIDKEEFDEMIRKYGNLLGSDNHLQNLSYTWYPVDSQDPVTRDI